MKIPKGGGTRGQRTRNHLRYQMVKLAGDAVRHPDRFTIQIARPRKRPGAEWRVYAVKLFERDKCLVKIFLAFEGFSEFDGLGKIDPLTHADAMPDLRLHLGGNHISVIAFVLELSGDALGIAALNQRGDLDRPEWSRPVRFGH